MDYLGLAVEAAEVLGGGLPCFRKSVCGVEITDLRLPPRAARRIGRAPGRYITLEGDADSGAMSALLGRALAMLLPKGGRLFAAGLGNPDVTHDSLGARTVRLLSAGEHGRFSLCAMETDVARRTGLDTARLVRAASRELPADCVIAVDALACRSPRRIGRTVQVSNAGLVPGSGTGASLGALTRRELGVPVVCVGVPMLALLSDVTGSERDGAFIVTTNDIDVTAGLWAETVAAAVNGVVLGEGG